MEGLPGQRASLEEIEDDVFSANPSMGMTLGIDFTSAGSNKATIEGFAIERLERWSPDVSGCPAIPFDLWQKTAIPAIGNAGLAVRTALAQNREMHQRGRI